ncbi:MAG: hypothetical protein ACOCQP_01815 [Lentisphaeria bacterium]
MSKFNYVNRFYYQTLTVRTFSMVAAFAIITCLMSYPTLADDDDKTEEVFPATSIHAGEIVSLTTTTASVNWLELESLMLDGELEQGASAGSAETERSPDDDKLFIIITVELAEDRSIGKYDYDLKVKGDVIECEGMARGEDEPFDPRTWQVEYDQGQTPVKLLYEVPRFGSEAVIDFIPALDTTIKLEEHELTVKPPPELVDDDDDDDDDDE